MSDEASPAPEIAVLNESLRVLMQQRLDRPPPTRFERLMRAMPSFETFYLVAYVMVAIGLMLFIVSIAYAVYIPVAIGFGLYGLAVVLMAAAWKIHA